MSAHLGDVDDIQMFPDPQMHGFPRALIEVRQERCGDLDEPAFDRSPHSQLEQQGAQPIAITDRFQQPDIHQGQDDIAQRSRKAQSDARSQGHRNSSFGVNACSTRTAELRTAEV